MTQPVAPKGSLPNFRPIAPSIAPLGTLSPRFQNPSLEGSNTTQLTDDFIYGHNFAGQKRLNAIDEQSLTGEQRQRRKEQNRAAQRAFRERKERYVKELEEKIKAMEESHANSMKQMQRENDELRGMLKQMHSEMESMKNAASSLHPAVRQLRDSGVEIPEIGIRDTPDNDKGKSNNQPVNEKRAHSASLNSTSSAVACIRDKDGVSFCERLKEEVCSAAYNQLLSEPLFDESGFLREDMSEHPVPILTEPLSDDESSTSGTGDDEFATKPDWTRADGSRKHSRLVACIEMWEKLSEHPRFEDFDLEELCQELRQKAKCAVSGPVLEERELMEVISKLESKV